MVSPHLCSVSFQDLWPTPRNPLTSITNGKARSLASPRNFPPVHQWPPYLSSFADTTVCLAHTVNCPILSALLLTPGPTLRGSSPCLSSLSLISSVSSPLPDGTWLPPWPTVGLSIMVPTTAPHPHVPTPEGSAQTLHTLHFRDLIREKCVFFLGV